MKKVLLFVLFCSFALSIQVTPRLGSGSGGGGGSSEPYTHPSNIALGNATVNSVLDMNTGLVRDSLKFNWEQSPLWSPGTTKWFPFVQSYYSDSQGQYHVLFGNERFSNGIDLYGTTAQFLGNVIVGSGNTQITIDSTGIYSSANITANTVSGYGDSFGFGFGDQSATTTLSSTVIDFYVPRGIIVSSWNVRTEPAGSMSTVISIDGTVIANTNNAPSSNWSNPVKVCTGTTAAWTKASWDRDTLVSMALTFGSVSTAKQVFFSFRGRKKQ